MTMHILQITLYGMLSASMACAETNLPIVSATDSKGLDTVLVGGITVNNEEIQDVLTILSQFTGLSMFATKSVVGRVSFSFPRDVTIRQVLESVLAGYGWRYQFDESKGTVNIMGEDDTSSLLTLASGSYVLRFMPVQIYLSIATSILSPNGKITVIPGSSKVVFEDIPSRTEMIQMWSPVIDYTYSHIPWIIFGLISGYLLAVYQRRRRFARLWRHAA